MKVRKLDLENMLRVGVISSSHGIRGEVKVFPTTDDVNRFKKLKSVILDTGKEQLTLTVESVKFFKQFAIVKFKEFNDINEILKYKGKDLLITREQAVPLKKDEFFICDLIGCCCVTEEGEELGTLSEVIQTGANDVFVIKKEEEELLIPYIDDCVKSVDVKEKKIVVHLLEGLR